jgi:hypothetical protein
MDDINYYDVLLITTPDTITDEEVRQQKTNAFGHWQRMEFSGIYGIVEQNQARDMKLKVEEAYLALETQELRQAYNESLRQKKEQFSFAKFGQIKVEFPIPTRHGNLSFNVIENPITAPLILQDWTIRSIQEYICRAWEDPDVLGKTLVFDRTLDRWLYYAAQDTTLAMTLKYYMTFNRELSTDQFVAFVLDLLQTRYPVPILPRGAPHLLEQVALFKKPQWDTYPKAVNFDILPNKAVVQSLTVRTWLGGTEDIQASIDNPLIKLNTSKLANEGVVQLTLNGSEVKSGDRVMGVLTLKSAIYGERRIPVSGLRLNWMGKMLGQGNGCGAAHDGAGGLSQRRASFS